MATIRTSTIRAISPNGEWNGMDKYLVTMADGIGYTFFYKQGEPFPKKLNEEVRFEVTNEQYKNARFAKAYSGYQKPYQKSYPSNQPQATLSTSKDDLIVRQTVIKSSCELNARNGNIDLVLEHAEIMYNWINRK
jgi:hypothetical protein